MIPPREEDPYIAWRPPFPQPVLGKEETAMLVIDMQYFDAHWDYGMCVKVREAGTDYRLRWFTPTVEVDLCGHATVAAYTCLAAEGRIFFDEGPVHLRHATRRGVLGEGNAVVDVRIGGRGIIVAWGEIETEQPG